jgi:pimeloyl-ACP methyl ester carboxylesterase
MSESIVREQFEQIWDNEDASGRADDVPPTRAEESMAKSISLPTGVRIEYVEQGRADGVPVVFLHGVTDSWRSFERVLPLLPPSVHAFALSQRGHGDSSRPPSGYRFADMSADLHAFLDAMGLRTAVVVGHSMGASVAQRFVIDHPDRVSRLVLMGAFANYEDPGLAAFVGSSVAPLTDPIARRFAREWQLSTLARAMPGDHLDAVVSETLKVPARVWREAFDGFLKTPDFTSGLTTVSVPVLLMWGDRDSYALRAAQDRLLEVMPKARFIVYQGGGHAFHWEDPEQFTRDLVSFLTRRSDSPGAQEQSRRPNLRRASGPMPYNPLGE